MGKRVFFGELIDFSAGVNLVRVKEDIPKDRIYTLDDFDIDLVATTYEDIDKDDVQKNDDKYLVASTGDVLISMTRNNATIVSNSNKGKLLTSNFTKCEFDKDVLYPWYFCYLINESSEIKRQIKKIQQGTLGCINRLTVNMIQDLKFVLININQQKVIGDLYRNMLIYQYLQEKQIENTKKCTLEIINRIVRS